MKLKNASQPFRQITLSAAILFLAVTAPRVLSAPPGEDDHQELRALLVTMTKAINESNFDLLEPIVADPFCFTTSDQVTFTSLADIKQHYDDVFKSGEYPVTALSVQPTATIETEFIDDTHGYCYGTATETYTLKSGQSMVLTSSWTGTVTKEGGQWKLSTAHVGIHFMENPIIDALGASLKWAMIGGLVVGVVIGLLLSKFMRRKKTGATSSASAA